MMKFLSLLLSLVFITCQSPKNQQSETTTTTIEKTEPAASYKDINVINFVKEIENSKAVVVDVRTPEEIAEGKVNGALEMDFYSKDFQNRLKTLDPQQPTYLYCRSGNRSRKASDMLIQMGFKEVYNLDGGYSAYSEYIQEQ